MAACAIDGCGRPFRARGWCAFHYNRWRSLGSPEPALDRIVGNDTRRFWSKVDKGEANECWPFLGGSRNSEGYPLFSVGGRNLMAARWVYEQEVGRIPEGWQVDHVAARGCSGPPCVNPAHLEAVTAAENRRRQAETDRLRTCTIEGCSEPHRAKGLCNRHWWKDYRERVPRKS